MDELLEYWLTRRGIKRGNVPNKATYFYRAYCRWVEKEFEGEKRLLSRKVFYQQLVKRGFKQTFPRGAKGRTTCWMLNKAIVPKNSLGV